MNDFIVSIGTICLLTGAFMINLGLAVMILGIVLILIGLTRIKGEQNGPH